MDIISVIALYTGATASQQERGKDRVRDCGGGGKLKKDKEGGIKILKEVDAGKRGRIDERSWWIKLHLCTSQFRTVGTPYRQLGIVCLNKFFFLKLHSQPMTLIKGRTVAVFHNRIPACTELLYKKIML